MSSSYDVAVVGGGVIGLTTALALAHSTSLRILLLESRSHLASWSSAAGQHGRVSALSPASQRIFERLGVWGRLSARQQTAISPYRAMHVWSGTGKGAIHFNAADLGVPVLGHIVANGLLEAALAERVADCPLVKVICSARPSALTFHGDHALIQADTGSFAARLVIGADGADSLMRERAMLPISVRDYGHTALVAEVETAYPHDETARQCFLPTGPLAFLPLSLSHHHSIVWSLTHDEASRMVALSDVDFCKTLGEAFQYRLGSVSQARGRRTFPLVMRHAQQYVRDHFALVGDAAHTIHPLAGQGMNLGLSDAAWLAETVAGALDRGHDYAAKYCLRRYERARKAETSLMLAAMDFFKWMPAHAHPMIQMGWQVGLRGVNSLPMVKKFLAGFAMGPGSLFD